MNSIPQLFFPSHFFYQKTVAKNQTKCFLALFYPSEQHQIASVPYSFFAKIEPSQDTSPFGKTATKRPELANSTIKYPLYTTHHHKTTLTRPKTTIVAIPDHQTTAKSPSFLAPAKDS